MSSCILDTLDVPDYNNCPVSFIDCIVSNVCCDALNSSIATNSVFTGTSIGFGFSSVTNCQFEWTPATAFPGVDFS